MRSQWWWVARKRIIADMYTILDCEYPILFCIFHLHGLLHQIFNNILCSYLAKNIIANFHSIPYRVLRAKLHNPSPGWVVGGDKIYIKISPNPRSSWGCWFKMYVIVSWRNYSHVCSHSYYAISDLNLYNRFVKCLGTLLKISYGIINKFIYTIWLHLPQWL